MTDLVDFALTTRARDDGSTLIALAGELDLHRVPALADALQAAAGSVVVDLQKVTFLDSTTLALLVHEHRRLQEAGRELTVLVGEQTPTTVFAVTGIDHILTIRSAEPHSSVVDSRARIVIADDHGPTRVLLRTLIELEGMDVVGEAEDGNEAVALALEHEPDVVLLDVNMPGLDGLGAAEIIRASRPRIRLLLHTGERLETVLDRAVTLQLPLADKRDLRLTIQQLAKQTQTGKRVAPPNGGRPR